MLKDVNIIVADDNLLNQKVATFMLQKYGAHVTCASTGKQVINFLKKTAYDIILMDLHMPEMDGYEAATYIRQEMKMDIPIIAFTADPLLSDQQACFDAGMNGCISKPLDAKKITQAIVSLVNNN